MVTHRKAVGLILSFLIIIATSSTPFRSIVSIPRHIRLAHGQEQQLRLDLPMSIYVRADKEGILSLNGTPLRAKSWTVAGSPISIQPVNLGQARLDFSLLGVIPIRRMVVDVLPQAELVPGGHSIGILLSTRGVSVVGYAAIGKGWHEANPAKEAGIRPGDVILKINGQEVESEEQVAQLIDTAGQNAGVVELDLRRNNLDFSTRLKPIYDESTNRYRIGLYVRDGTAGVGTLTFYDPSTRKYAALGHLITDGATNRPMDIKTGKIVKAAVAGVQKGREGSPGEKIGVFVEDKDEIGNIELNTEFGISGTLKIPLQNSLYSNPIPVAMAAQVEEGPAEIITVIDDHRLRRYTIEILRVIRQDRPDGKGLIIKVTDPDLLRKTGGIVQGMSGSPIIQHGRLVGAVTHVFVNDPTRGYGVFAEWMVTKLGLLKPAATSQLSRKVELWRFFIAISLEGKRTSA